MREGLTRRDFLNGAALSIGATLTPAGWLSAAEGAADYPPTLNGMRGSTDASYAVAHALRDGRRFSFEGVASEGVVDLLVVGAGISGLAAAYYYRQRAPDARILLIDNHDDFGGHARRCEMRVGEQLLVSYGGSESIQSPGSLWSGDALGLLASLGVDLQRFETAFHRDLYPDLGLSRGVLFKREDFGVDKLVSGDPTRMVADDIAPDRLNERAVGDFIRDFPVDTRSRERLVALYTQPRNFWPNSSLAERMTLLAAMSYREFLTKHWGLSEQAVKTFQRRPHDFFAVGIDLLPASEAAATGYPGFDGLGLPIHPHSAAKLEDAYIHHFPDGNASIARLLVRKLIPAAATGSTMEDIVTAAFDYSQLDANGAATRLKLNGTVVHMANIAGGRVEVGYVHGGALRRVLAKSVVYAGYHSMLPYLLPELGAGQRRALAYGTKAPIVYAKLAVRNWRPWVEAGVHEITNPTGFYSRIKLDYPVSLGSYRSPTSPDQPIVLHLVHVPLADNGADQRVAWRAGRARLYETSFGVFEGQAVDELTRALGPSGFDADRDLVAMSVYRWGHGYAYGYNSLFDEDRDLALQEAARQRVGRIAIANSDAAWSAYAHAAIEEARRAVREVDD